MRRSKKSGMVLKMNDYIITSDNMADLPESYIRENRLQTMSLTYMLDGGIYSEDNPLPYKEFYAKMRAGSMPTTSQVNPEEAKIKLLEFLKFLLSPSGNADLPAFPGQNACDFLPHSGGRAHNDSTFHVILL